MRIRPASIGAAGSVRLGPSLALAATGVPPCRRTLGWPGPTRASRLGVPADLAGTDLWLKLRVRVSDPERRGRGGKSESCKIPGKL